MSETKINLLDLDRDAMRAFFVELGEKPFRADQVMKWIYHFGCDDFDQMTNVNKVLKERRWHHQVGPAGGRSGGRDRLHPGR